MTRKELKELMEKAKAATPGPWYASIGSDEDGELSIVGPAYLGDSLQNILNNAVCYLKPDNIQSNCNNIYIAAANPKVVLDLCERVIGLSESLGEIISELSYGRSKIHTDWCLQVSNRDLARYGVKNETTSG